MALLYVVSVEVLQQRGDVLGVLAEPRHENGELQRGVLYGAKLGAGELDGFIAEIQHRREFRPASELRKRA
jgi:hypothetical protein